MGVEQKGWWVEINRVKDFFLVRVGQSVNGHGNLRRHIIEVVGVMGASKKIG